MLASNIPSKFQIIGLRFKTRRNNCGVILREINDRTTIDILLDGMKYRDYILGRDINVCIKSIYTNNLCKRLI